MQNPSKKILVVDDEAKIAEVLKSYLEHSGYEVFEAYNGRDALEIFGKISPSLIILDLMLPDMTGEEICIKIRKQSGVPIIMLTAKIEEADILKGLNIGADDYVTKPFSPRQVVARVEAILRRVSDENQTALRSISFNNEDLVIDPDSHEIKKNGNNVNLTPNEYKLLMTMIRYPKKTFTREELISMALGDEFDGFDRTVDTHVKNLRQKIETDPKAAKYIITVHGVGYRFGGD